jgi:hypothetical protein
LHMIEPFYVTDVEEWQGRIVDNHELFKNTNEKISRLEKTVKEEISAVENRIAKVIEDKLNANMKAFDQLGKKISKLEDKMNKIIG